jgi:hypothetical protein
MFDRAFWRGVLEGMAMPLPWLAAWSCYGIGHALSKVVNLVPDRFERTGEHVAGGYQAFMRWSLFLNDRFKLLHGPWGTPPLNCPAIKETRSES